jgi:hypothetical protein
MIDTAFVEQRMRDINPVSGVDGINPEELTRAVAVVATARAVAMQTPTRHHTTTEPQTTPPPLRRRKAWAFAAALIVILASIGIAALTLRTSNAPVTDEPAPPTDIGSWQVSNVAEPWASSIVDVASLPGGGFVVAVDHSEGSVLWSPDGIDWTEADPRGEVEVTVPSEPGDQPQVVAVLADRVAILDSEGPRVWVGDLATRAWESISLDTAGLIGTSRAWAIASNDRQVLVVARWSLLDSWEPPEGYDPDYVAWLIDPETGGVERQTVPLGGSVHVGLAASWFEDRWVIAGSITAVSRNGLAWTLGSTDTALVTSLTAGPSGIVMTACGGFGPHPAFYSEDGLDWVKVPVPGPHSGSAYSDTLGFIIPDYDQNALSVSLDGRTWWTVPAAAGYVIEDFINLAASDTTIFVDHGWRASLLTPEWHRAGFPDT